MHSTICDLHQMKEVTLHLQEDAHLFLDIDNTLIEPLDEIGSVQWGDLLKMEFMKAGLEEKIADERASLIWRALQMVVPVRLIEEGVREFLLKLKEQKVPITLITARSPDVTEITLEQLVTVGLHLTQVDLDHLLYLSKEPVVIKKGTIFCGGVDKGTAMKSFLEKIDTRPKKIVFVDDCLDNLLHAQKAMASEGIAFVGLRYAYLDEKVSRYKESQRGDLLHKLFTNTPALHFLLKGLSHS